MGVFSYFWVLKVNVRRPAVLLSFLFVLALPVLAVPPTPTNTPLAHPLAPNPHTSVGVFWIYTDANTGRQWTGGTYKVKRCSGAACTPTTVVASGLTSADYQDTGLTANTIYGYRYLANDGSDSGDSPTVYVTTLAADSNFAQFPNATWETLLGPLPEAAQIPFAYFNDTATTRGQDLISKLPVVAPATLLGTCSTTSGSKVVTCTNTRLLEQVAANNPTCLDAFQVGATNLGAIDTVDSNTQLTLVNNAPSTQNNQSITTNIAGLCGFGDPLSDWVMSDNLLYYDSPKGLWELYFRTGDPQYMRGAIQASEAVFAGAWWLGRNRAFLGFSTTDSTEGAPSPRHFQYAGYALLGLAGHNGVWDLLDKYLTDRYPGWISNYRGGNNDFLFLREKAYVIRFTIWFVNAAPDSFPRSNGTVTSLNGGTTVDGDLTDGRKDHWRDQLNIDVPGFILDDQTPDGLWYETGAGSANAENDWPYPPGVEQPWLAGLLADALGTCWRSTPLSSTARDAARKMVLRFAAATATRGYNQNIMADEPGSRWRTGWYFLGGGTRLNPYAAEYGIDSAILNNTPDNNMEALYRQALPFAVATSGWAYEMSGQAIYKTWGDEIANAMNAAVGENTGGTGDGKKALCHTGNYKSWGECFAIGSGQYFARRLTTYSSLGTPPSVTMPGNQTLTGGVNQATLTASVSCTNTPCNYKWYLVEYPLGLPRQNAQAMFTNDTSLTATLSGMESGVYKVGFYALDNLGMVGQGTVNVTVGDGVFPPVVNIYNQFDAAPWQCTTGTSLTNIRVRAYSAAGRSITHAFSITGPKDASAATVTPSGTTGNFVTVDVTNLTATSSSWYILKDVVSDGTTTRVGYFVVSKHSTCGSFEQPSSGHNTIPVVAKHPNHVLPAGATSTRLMVAPVDPEGTVWFTSTATGYTANMNDFVVVTALTHSWSQVGGPVTATITNGSTIRPDITGMTQAGTYTFRYTGTDHQSDTVTADITVTTSDSEEEPSNVTVRVRISAVVLTLAICFSIGLLTHMLRSYRLYSNEPRVIKPTTERYYSVVGPDRKKRLRGGEPVPLRLRVKDFIKRSRGS